MKIEGYTVQFNTSATKYSGRIIDVVPYWRLYRVDRSDRNHPVRTAIGVYSLHELRLYFRNMYDNGEVLPPKHMFEAYARVSGRVNRKPNSMPPEEFKEKIRQLKKALAKLDK